MAPSSATRLSITESPLATEAASETILSRPASCFSSQASWESRKKPAFSPQYVHLPTVVPPLETALFPHPNNPLHQSMQLRQQFPVFLQGKVIHVILVLAAGAVHRSGFYHAAD